MCMPITMLRIFVFGSTNHTDITEKFLFAVKSGEFREFRPMAMKTYKCTRDGQKAAAFIAKERNDHETVKARRTDGRQTNITSY